jgi:hypothetical protein
VLETPEENTINVEVKDYDSILEDGVNVRKTYKFIKDISEIKSNLYKIDL